LGENTDDLTFFWQLWLGTLCVTVFRKVKLMKNNYATLFQNEKKPQNRIINLFQNMTKRKSSTNEGVATIKERNLQRYYMEQAEFKKIKIPTTKGN
jgi:hypothetical protein